MFTFIFRTLDYCVASLKDEESEEKGQMANVQIYIFYVSQTFVTSVCVCMKNNAV